MILNTFQHIKGISAKKEGEFWRSGILTWDDFEKRLDHQMSLFGDMPDNSILLSSKEAFDTKDADFFRRLLSPQEYYRIALTFPEKTLFLDIETTGLSKYYDTITLVGWCIGKEYGVFIQGESDKDFRQALKKAEIVVTFNGSLFDLPFLKRHKDDLCIPACHIDLRFLSKRVGLTGGQKEIEAIIGFKRPKGLANVIGETAPLLWYKYCWGDIKALKQLILYNQADIEGMKVIFDEAVKRLLEKYRVPQEINRNLYRFSKNKSKISWVNGAPSLGGIKIKPYSGKTGPLVFLSDLDILSGNPDFSVVGIDLTGSETRPSGWCFLKGSYAETRCLSTDEEIINETLKCRPRLVSIDSPLSLPFGRKVVTDDDPGRDTYGIMRKCERILKNRGVNVYPSLIPSMQKLTARGIRLANKFRKRGIPVIESYPGAAQDIMGIPRKRQGLEYLSRGLELFGIKGDFIDHEVSHDELDAITSAVVGLFFWSGKFEALGNEEEDYLIIPDLKANTKSWQNRRVIGLSGPIASGKTTAGKIFEAKGYAYGSYSNVLKKILIDRGMTPDRATLQETGIKINKAPGQRWLCQQVVKALPESGNIVIDGLRHPEDYAFMIETYGPAFVHIHIKTHKAIRRLRYINTGSTEEEFLEASEHNVEAKVSDLSSLANLIIRNEDSIISFEKSLIKLFRNIRQYN